MRPSHMPEKALVGAVDAGGARGSFHMHLRLCPSHTHLGDERVASRRQAESHGNTHDVDNLEDIARIRSHRVKGGKKGDSMCVCARTLIGRPALHQVTLLSGKTDLILCLCVRDLKNHTHKAPLSTDWSPCLGQHHT